MKISKLFHWLYFSVMMLPLVVAPIFAIYSHRHQLTENAEASIQYKYQSNEVDSSDDLVEGNIYRLTINNNTIDEITTTDGELSFTLVNVYEYDFNDYHSDFSIDDLLLTNSTIDGSVFIEFRIISFSGYLQTFLGFPESEDYFASFYIGNLDEHVFTFIADVVYNFSYESDALYHFMSYTDFNEIKSVDFSDTDIMHVFVNNYADTIDKYFNYDNVVNFSSLYTWLNTTFFSGAAPLGFFIFWHLLEYWLLTSLIWLLFDVLMYVPLLVHKWLDKASIE